MKIANPFWQNKYLLVRIANSSKIIEGKELLRHRFDAVDTHSEQEWLPNVWIDRISISHRHQKIAVLAMSNAHFGRDYQYTYKVLFPFSPTARPTRWAYKSVVISSVDGSQELLWSPDEKYLVTVRNIPEPERRSHRLFLIDVAKGKAWDVRDDKGRYLEGVLPQWLPDGKSFLYQGKFTDNNGRPHIAICEYSLSTHKIKQWYPF
jgi:hypothetical protein